MISSSEAFLIFRKWKEESSTVEFLGGSLDTVPTLRPPGTFSRVVDVSESPPSVSLQHETGDRALLSIKLDGALFEYADTRELLRPESGRDWVCFLVVKLPSGHKFVFGERKSSV